MRTKDKACLSDKAADRILQEVLRECKWEPSSLLEAQKRVEKQWAESGKLNKEIMDRRAHL